MTPVPKETFWIDSLTSVPNEIFDLTFRISNQKADGTAGLPIDCSKQHPQAVITPIIDGPAKAGVTVALDDSWAAGGTASDECNFSIQEAIGKIVGDTQGSIVGLKVELKASSTSCPYWRQKLIINFADEHDWQI